MRFGKFIYLKMFSNVLLAGCSYKRRTWTSRHICPLLTRGVPRLATHVPPGSIFVLESGFCSGLCQWPETFDHICTDGPIILPLRFVPPRAI